MIRTEKLNGGTERVRNRDGELLRLRIGDGGTEIVSKRDGGSERDGDLGFTIRVRDIV
jgi:hypothetical protein